MWKITIFVCAFKEKVKMSKFNTVNFYSKTSGKTKNSEQCSNENEHEDSALLNSTVDLSDSFITSIIGNDKSSIEFDKLEPSEIDAFCKEGRGEKRKKGARNYCEIDENSDENSDHEILESDADEDYFPKRFKQASCSVSDQSENVKRGRPGRPKGSKNGFRKSEQKYVSRPKQRGRPKGSKNKNQANEANKKIPKIVVNVDDNENCPKENKVNDSESGTINGGTGVTSPVKKYTKTSRSKVRNPDQWQRNVKKI